MRFARHQLPLLALVLGLLASACAPTDASLSARDVAADLPAWALLDDGSSALAAFDSVTLDRASVDAVARTYLISSRGILGDRFRSIARGLGDEVLVHHPDAGFAAVRTSRPETYRRVADVVVHDVTLQWIEPLHRSVARAAEAVPGAAEVQAQVSSAFFDELWNVHTVRAPQAWSSGVRGAGVTIAILDGGFGPGHPDLAPNVDLARSANFVADELLQYCYDAEDDGVVPDVEAGVCVGTPDPFSHGNHVAGIAAAAPGYGVVGVAPDATLMLVKVLGDRGSGSFLDVVLGMLHAGVHGANVINMSMSAEIPQRGFCVAPDGDEPGFCVGAHEVAMLKVLMQRVANVLHTDGITIVAAAGNDGLDLNTTADLLVLPAGLQRVVSVSATGPTHWALGHPTDFEALALYSNFGRRGIDHSAPGGDIRSLLAFLEDPATAPVCDVGGYTDFCFLFDFVLSSGTGPVDWFYSVGTSMAAPAVAGVAALVISERGGTISPVDVERELMRRAFRPSGRGMDPAHGHGAVRSGH